MSFKNIGLSIMFVFFSAYNFIYTPLSYVSYWLGVLFAVASIGVFIKDSKSKKKND
jgi:hypothetical protein